jgi:hypothetical protein
MSVNATNEDEHTGSIWLPMTPPAQRASFHGLSILQNDARSRLRVRLAFERARPISPIWHLGFPERCFYETLRTSSKRKATYDPPCVFSLAD